ncbi:MAG: glutaredoxin 3 [Desulfobacterales bacterium]|nr:glutaredoxin 3 [Desulfobacterales bacterium]MBS3809957.1 glutaredoxin 3 [Desulfobacterales bacterium]
MPKVEIYTTLICPYSLKAKELLEEKGVAFSEFRIEGNQERTAEAKQRSGGRETVPQIFIDNEHVGGYHELSTMEMEGKLDPMLGLS